MRWTTLAAVVTTITQLLQVVVLANLLPPTAFGLMAMVMIVIGFAQAYADAGISSAIVHRQDTTPNQLSSLYWLNVVVGGVIFGLLWVFTPLIAKLFNENQLIPILRIAAIIFLIMPFGKQYEVLLQKDLQFSLLARQEVIAALISSGLAIACAFAGMGVWALVIGQLALVAIRTLLLLWIGLPIHRPSAHFRLEDLQGYWQFGAYQLGERSINLLTQRIDQLLIGSLLGVQALGYYSFAFNLVSQPQSRINPIVTKVAFPTFAKIQDNVPRLQRGYLSVVKMLTLVNAPLLIGIIVLAPMFVPLVFGEVWLPSIVLIQLAALVALLRSMGNPVGSLLLARGRADLGFKWNLGLLFVSTPFIGASALWGDVVTVASMWVFLQLILQLPAYLWLIRPLIGSCGVSYIKATALPVALALIMGSIVWLGQALLEPSWLSLLLLIGLGGSSYFLILLVAERKMLVDLGSMMFTQWRPLGVKKTP